MCVVQVWQRLLDDQREKEGMDRLAHAGQAEALHHVRRAARAPTGKSLCFGLWAFGFSEKSLGLVH